MQKLFSLLKRHRRFLLPLMGMVILFLAFPSLTFADTDSADTGSDGGSLDDIAQDLMRLITIALAFLQVLLYPLVTIIGALMDNELIIGVGMEGKLREIWVIIRDWVNIFFVLALVVIALYNVLGVAGEGSNYALKSILPKIVIGLVAVNFSFLAGKVLLDATAVLTSAVYALPTDLDLWDDQARAMEIRLCDNDKDRDGDATEADELLSIENGNLLAVIFCEEEEGEEPEYFKGVTSTPYEAFNDIGESYFKNFGAHNVALTLMVNMGQVTTIDQVSSSADSVIDQFSNLTLQTLFGILMFLMFGFAYVAMVVVLLARVVILWICLALSPFIVLLFLFPDLTNFGGNELDLKTQFFKHLFVPVVMGVVFSVGFTMLSVFQGSTSGSWLGAIGELEINTLGTSQDIERLSALGQDISQFQDLIIAVAAVIIIWTGTFAAASQTIASNWTQTIKGAGEATGKFLASTPLYATVIPIQTATGKTENMGLMNLLGAIPKAMNMAQQKREDKTTAVARGIVGGNKYDKLVDGVLSEAQDKHSAENAIHRLAKTKGSAEERRWAKVIDTTKEELGLTDARYANDPKVKALLAAAAAGNDQRVLELLKSGDYNATVFGGRKPEWETEDVSEDSSESSSAPTPSHDADVAEASGALKAPRAKKDGDDPKQTPPPATTLGEVENKNDVKRTLEIEDLSVTQLSEIFTDPSAPGLAAALKDFRADENSGAERSAEFAGIPITNGKLDAPAFVEAMTEYQKKKAPTSPVGDPTSPGTGGAPPAGSTPAPDSPPLAPSGPPPDPGEGD